MLRCLLSMPVSPYSSLSFSLQSSYSQLLAATCLSKLVSRTSNPLPLEQRIDIRKTHSHTSHQSIFMLYKSVHKADICVCVCRELCAELSGDAAEVGRVCYPGSDPAVLQVNVSSLPSRPLSSSSLSRPCE